MDPRQGLIEAANELGMPPLDLATIVSYESGFRPDVQGGAGGQHYGYIQFGPHEQQAYGVNRADPVGSQLGRGGAIVKYFRDRGWKPGMGLLDAYSIVNAGRPGLYNASDAPHGGLPGNVADKVASMGPHRQKAANWLNMDTSASNVRYDPRKDTPSTAHPTGSTLPGPPPAAAGTPPVTAPALTRDDLAGIIGAGQIGSGNTFSDRLQKMVAGMAPDPSKFGMGQAPQMSSPPGFRQAQMQPMVDPQQQEARRQSLAMAMQRLYGQQGMGQGGGMM